MKYQAGNTESVLNMDVDGYMGGANARVNLNVDATKDSDLCAAPSVSSFKSLETSPTVPASSLASTTSVSVASFAISHATTTSTTIDGSMSMSMSMSLSEPGKKAVKRNRPKTKQKPGLTAKGAERKFVEHNYVDRAWEVHENMNDNENALYENYTIFNHKRKECCDAEGAPHAGHAGHPAKKLRTAPFPLKLHMMLSYIARKDLDRIASWLPHGRAFQIHDIGAFQEQIMNKFFTMTRITSFHRQLNLYGFIRLTNGKDEGAYYNEFFLRGKPYLTMHINRIKVKGTKIRAASSPDQEPDFYSMPYVNADNDHNNPKGDSAVMKNIVNSNKKSLSTSETNERPKSRRTRFKRDKPKGKGSIRRKGGGYKATSADLESTDKERSGSETREKKSDFVQSLPEDKPDSQIVTNSIKPTSISPIQLGDIVGGMSCPSSPIRRKGGNYNYTPCESGEHYHQHQQQADHVISNTEVTYGANANTTFAVNQDVVLCDHNFQPVQNYQQMQMQQLPATEHPAYLHNNAHLSHCYSQPTFAVPSAGVNNYAQPVLATSYSSAIEQQNQNHNFNISTNPNLNSVNNQNAIPYTTTSAQGDAWGPRYQRSEATESVTTSAYEESWHNYRYQPSIPESVADTAVVSDHVFDGMIDLCSNGHHNDDQDYRKELVDKFEQWENDSLEPLDEDLKNLVNRDENEISRALANFHNNI